MYLSIYNLRKAPFAMTPDPNAFYVSATHREALVGLSYSIMGEKGFALLTGDAGMGKTTLTARIMQQLPSGRIKASIVFNPTVTPAEFLEMVLLNFGVEWVPPSKPQRLAMLRKMLTEADEHRSISLLIVDEAHKLSAELLEEIRLLGNFERADKKLLQIVLVGQSELAGILDAPELWQFKQRFATRVHIARLNAAEVAEYVRFRWVGAGGAEVHPFSAEALAAVAKVSNGIPRVINALCENALLLALAEGHTTVNAGHVLQIGAEMNIAIPAEPAPQAALPCPPTPEVDDAPARITCQPVSATPDPALTVLDRYARPSLFRRCAAMLRFAS